MESTVSDEIVGAGQQIMSLVIDEGITNFLAVLCIVILVGIPVALIWLAVIFAKPATKAADALETIADQTMQHTDDHKEIKEWSRKSCQGIEILKDRRAQQ